VIRIAAVGDVHFGADSFGTLRPHLGRLAEQADVLLLAGDLTTCGDPGEAAVLAAELRDLEVPAIGVLGNHDYHGDREAGVRAALEAAGVRVLEGESAIVEVDGVRVGVVGMKGFGGGFAGACASDFGEPQMKAFIGHTKELAGRLETALRDLESDLKIVLLHYSPIKATLIGERLELYPFLGSFLLAEAVDRSGADLVLHGHAHHGSEKGVTPGGIHVRNVAQPVIRHAYNLYSLAAGPRASTISSDAIEAATRDGG
jgi:Icc-related predicted phosphoesterase